MKALPLGVGTIHFVGIGGAGMNGIAQVMLNLGYQVSGSDIRQNAATVRLAEQGAAIHIGHTGAHIQGVDAVVISSAIKEDNPEVVAAREPAPLAPPGDGRCGWGWHVPSGSGAAQDLADQVGDRGVGRRQLLAVAVRPVDPVDRGVVLELGDEIARMSAHIAAATQCLLHPRAGMAQGGGLDRLAHRE